MGGLVIGFVVLVSFSIKPLTPGGSKYIKQRADFTFEYCEKYELPYYVRYVINKEDIFGDGDRKSSRWKADKGVASKTAQDKDYVRSGYDRGHLKPAACSKTSQFHMNQSHLFSNCTPQDPKFNRVGWRLIEKKVRHIVGDGIQDSIIVYTGPVLKGITKYIGSVNKIGVPKYHFKAILYGDSTKAYAYLCPNKPLYKPYSQYIVSIDSLEKVIGYDLYVGLKEELEK
jgi:endonuclease G